MSDGIQVIVPLSIFEGVESLTPQNIMKMFDEVATSKDRIAQLETKIGSLKNVIRQMGLSLQDTLDNSSSEFIKAQRLRALVEDMKNYG